METNENTENKPTWGQQVAQLILLAKRRKAQSGEILTMREVAEIIDAADEGRRPFEPEPAKTAIQPEFGDRKKIPPLPEWVTAYSASIGYPINGQTWCDTYAAKGWNVGRQKMKDWQAAVRNWRTNDWAAPAMKVQPTTGRDYSKF